MMLKKKYIVLILISSLIYKLDAIINDEQENDENEKVVFLSPKYASKNQNIQLNNRIERFFLNSIFQKGWLIEADKKQTFNLYILLKYYSSNSNYSMPFLNNSDSNKTSATIIRKFRQSSNHQIYQHTFYIYFTLNDSSCDDYLDYNHIPVLININTSSTVKDSYLHKIEVDFILRHAPYQSYYLCLSKQTIDDEHYLVEKFIHQGTNHMLSIVTYENLFPIWIKVIIYIILVCFNSIFNGLNLGLMALSVEELCLLVKTSESEKERKYAKNILPLRRKRNYLLCSILLSVTLTGSVSTLILDSMVEGFFAGIISTITLVIFGEILPQSICSKYSLPIGSYTRKFTYFFIYITSIVSYPLSKIVDYLLGDEIPTKYSRDSIKELIKKSKGLEEKQCKIINGVLDLKGNTVANRMINLDNVFMLQEETNLTFETIVQIYNSGYSRIPVYSRSREDLIGWFHIKDLTLIDPDDEIKVKTLLSYFKHHISYCYINDSLFDMLMEFRNGSTHMAFVLEMIQNTNQDPYDRCVGIITLHDVLEALIQHNIYDESEFSNGVEIKGTSAHSFSNMKSAYGVNYLRKLINNELRQKSLTNLKLDQTNQEIKKCISSTDLIMAENQMYNHHINSQTRLIILQILSTIKPFQQEFIDKSIIEKMLNNTEEIIFKMIIPRYVNVSKLKQDQIYLYKYKESCEHFILLLEGSLIIEAGIERTLFVVKQFDHFGVKALLGDCESVKQVLDNDPPYNPYTPEFSLKIDYKSQFDFNANNGSGNHTNNNSSNYACLTYLKINRSAWLNAVKSTQFKNLHHIINNNNNSSNNKPN